MKYIIVITKYYLGPNSVYNLGPNNDDYSTGHTTQPALLVFVKCPVFVKSPDKIETSTSEFCQAYDRRVATS